MRKPWQYTLLGAAIAFFVLYGIELSSDGMEDVYGPLEPRAVDRTGSGSGNGYGYGEAPSPAGSREAQSDPYDAWPDESESVKRAAQGSDGYGEWPERNGGYGGYGYPYDGAEGGGGAVSRLADGTAGLLQSMAKGGIRIIVSLFESVTK